MYIYTQNVFEEVKLTLKVLTCFHIEYNFAYKYIGYFKYIMTDLNGHVIYNGCRNLCLTSLLLCRIIIRQF